MKHQLERWTINHERSLRVHADNRCCVLQDTPPLSLYMFAKFDFSAVHVVHGGTLSTDMGVARCFEIGSGVACGRRVKQKRILQLESWLRYPLQSLNETSGAS